MKTVIITVVGSQRRWPTLAGAVLLAALPVAAGCSTAEDDRAQTPGARGGCPSARVGVVVSVDQWGDIVTDLGGACAEVATLLASSSADPHDYEPSPADAVSFSGAQLVVINGGHYDEWAGKLAAGSAPQAAVISAVSDDRPNPHAWYDPAAVRDTAERVTAKLSELSPGAADYFNRRHAAFIESLQPYDRLIASIKAGAAGKAYAATENVFDDMAAAVGLVDRTPAGYATASRNETDPSPADLKAMLTVIEDGGVDVLVYNTSTEGSGPQQIRDAARATGIPVLEVTETVAPGAESFQAWQVAQLRSLAEALGVRA